MFSIPRQATEKFKAKGRAICNGGCQPFEYSMSTIADKEIVVEPIGNIIFPVDIHNGSLLVLNNQTIENIRYVLRMVGLPLRSRLYITIIRFERAYRIYRLRAAQDTWVIGIEMEGYQKMRP
ncbi:hypothetical protein NQZ79_g8642 [Umbelopsis isabellina]|nr:hypothetical protein NQZ79_g8642 [Umbelopsis isabellina]